LVFIDNGSPESKRGVFERYAKPEDLFIRYRDNSKGWRRWWLAGMDHGVGRAYAILMDDDILIRGGLEKRLEPILSGRAEMTYSDLQNTGNSEDVFRPGNISLADEEREHRIPLCTMAFSPDMWGRLGAIPDTLSYKCDYLSARIPLLHGRAEYVPEITVKYRRHDGAEGRLISKEVGKAERKAIEAFWKKYKAEAKK
jgi:glycosyltransferase involved in cell wall biosynthesis